MVPSQDDVEALRGLPELLLREGWIDLVCAAGRYGIGEGTVPGLPPRLGMLVDLLALGRPVPGGLLHEVLGEDLAGALLRLGVVVRQGEACHTAGLVLVPLWGQAIFVPAPGGTGVYFGQDTLDLAARLSPRAGASWLDLWAGAGALSLRLALLAGVGVAVEEGPVALGLAELNLALAGAGERVELRRGEGPAALRSGERFGFVAAVPPVVPLGPAVAEGEDDGMAALRQVLEALPEVLAPQGAAELVACGVGGPRAPALCAELERYASERHLRVAMTVPARVRLRPGDRTFEALALRGAALAGSGEDEARRRLLLHLAGQGIEYLYRFFLCVSNGGPPGLSVAALY